MLISFLTLQSKQLGHTRCNAMRWCVLEVYEHVCSAQSNSNPSCQQLMCFRHWGGSVIGKQWLPSPHPPAGLLPQPAEHTEWGPIVGRVAAKRKDRHLVTTEQDPIGAVKNRPFASLSIGVKWAGARALASTVYPCFVCSGKSSVCACPNLQQRQAGTRLTDWEGRRCELGVFAKL